MYYFEGFKVINNDRGFDLWEDTTTLYITIHNGDGPDKPALAKGILKIEPDDFRRQMTNTKVINADNLGQRLKAKVRFGKLFLGELFKVYGPFR